VELLPGDDDEYRDTDKYREHGAGDDVQEEWNAGRRHDADEPELRTVSRRPVPLRRRKPERHQHPTSDVVPRRRRTRATTAPWQGVEQEARRDDIDAVDREPGVAPSPTDCTATYYSVAPQ